MKRSQNQLNQKSQSNGKNHDENEDKMFRFTPLLHIQRKRQVLDVVIKYIEEKFPINTNDSSVLKMVDVGCEKCAFFQYYQMELIGIKNCFDTDYIGIDIDEFTLKNETVEGLNRHSLGNVYDIRNGSISVRLMAENVLNPCQELALPDVLVMIEVIEHLQPADAEERLQHAIFGEICPDMAIITTPNADFNPVFGMHSRLQYRHWDHKFEWTRAEYAAWCGRVTQNYPEYEYAISDIGTTPQYCDSLGGGSQMAVFRRRGASPLQPSTALKTASKTVFERVNFFPAQSATNVVHRYLCSQMNNWAINRTVCVSPFDTSVVSTQDSDSGTAEDQSSCFLHYDEETDTETVRIPITVVASVVEYNFPGVSVDLVLLMRDICTSHTYFKFDEASGSIYYTIVNDYDDSLDEEEYLESMNKLSNINHSKLEIVA